MKERGRSMRLNSPANLYFFCINLKRDFMWNLLHNQDKLCMQELGLVSNFTFLLLGQET